MNSFRTLFFTLALVALGLTQSRGDEPPPMAPLEPSVDTPAPEAEAPAPSPLRKLRDLTEPVGPRSTEGEAPEKIVVGHQILRNTNPVTLGRTFHSSYTNGEFLSTHGTVHSNPGSAMIRSMAPVAGNQNTVGAVKGSLNATNLAVSLGYPVAQEMVREWVHNGKIDPKQLAHEVNPGALGGSFVGGTAGTVAGAAVQSTLAGFGPIGVVAGFFARPLLGFAGGAFGASYGNDAAHHDFSVKDAFHQSVANFKPGRDLGSVAGGTIGMVVGQALIPIPGVGAFVGSMAGTMIGGWVGSTLFHEGPTHPVRGLIQGGIKGLLGKTDAHPPSTYHPVESLSR